MTIPRCIHCQYITDGATINPDMLVSEKQMPVSLKDILNGK